MRRASRATLAGACSNEAPPGTGFGSPKRPWARLRLGRRHRMRRQISDSKGARAGPMFLGLSYAIASTTPLLVPSEIGAGRHWGVWCTTVLRVARTFRRAAIRVGHVDPNSAATSTGGTPRRERRCSPSVPRVPKTGLESRFDTQTQQAWCPWAMGPSPRRAASASLKVPTRGRVPPATDEALVHVTQRRRAISSPRPCASARGALEEGTARSPRLHGRGRMRWGACVSVGPTVRLGRRGAPGSTAGRCAAPLGIPPTCLARRDYSRMIRPSSMRQNRTSPCATSPSWSKSMGPEMPR
jgi:hypothetical protein